MDPRAFSMRNSCGFLKSVWSAISLYRWTSLADFASIFIGSAMSSMSLFVPFPWRFQALNNSSFHPRSKKIADEPRGLVLVTGTTGSGKSTTLAAIINYINSSRSRHIITIEDPIEYVHEDKQSILSQRELEQDTLSYPRPSKHSVRQDPDVVFLGRCVIWRRWPLL